MKNIQVMIEYLGPMRSKSTPIPPTTAIPRFVRSMSETQYMNPKVRTRRKSMRRIIFFCWAGVKALMRASFSWDSVEEVRSRCETGTFSASIVWFSGFVLGGGLVLWLQDERRVEKTPGKVWQVQMAAVMCRPCV
jgi:hypothetical protein